MPSVGAKRLYYGWIVLAASFVIIVFSQGVTFSFAEFMGPLQEEFDATWALISWIPAVAGLIHGPSNLYTGWFTDRFGPRTIVIVGAFAIGLGLLLASRAGSPWQLFASYGLMVGFGTSCTYVPLAATASRWFVGRRGLALGIITSGIGFGTVLVPPVAAHLILAHGWRTTYLVIGFTVWVIVVAAALFLKKQPDDVTTSLRGQISGQEGHSEPLQLTGLTFRQATRTRALWLLAASLTLFTLTLMMVMYHLVVYAEGLGISKVTAATFLSAIGGANIVGRLSVGVLSDRAGRKPLFVVCLLVQAAMMLWLMQSSSIWMFYVFAVAWGFAYGGVGPMIPAVTGELFGLRHMGSIFGLVILTMSVGGAVGPTLAGYIVDATGGYSVAFLIGAIATFLSALGICFLRRPGAHG